MNYSFAHLRALFNEYEAKNGKSMEDSIKREMSGNLSKTYLALSTINKKNLHELLKLIKFMFKLKIFVTDLVISQDK